MSIYSNDNIRKIAKLTTRELPQKSKNAKITVRENNGLYSNWITAHNYGRPKWHSLKSSLSWKGNILGIDIVSQRAP